MSSVTLNAIHEKYKSLQVLIDNFAERIINRSPSENIPGEIAVSTDDNRSLVVEGFGQIITATPKIIVTDSVSDFTAIYRFLFPGTQNAVFTFYLSSSGDAYMIRMGNKTELGRFDDYDTVENIHGNAVISLLESSAFQK
jgi:hypothetical protein